jgi:hypothetical protein
MVYRYRRELGIFSGLFADKIWIEKNRVVLIFSN